MRAAERFQFPLSPGDAIGVVATGFAALPAAVRAGIARLERMGFHVVAGPRLFARDGYFAGSDRERAAELNRCLRDPRLRAIWFARGGYGTARILPHVDWDALAAHPKLLVGYSDATALFARAAGRGLAPCVYGPMVSELADRAAFHAPSLARAIRGEPIELRFAASKVLRAGRAAGPLLGGNLTVLAHLLGTPFAPRLDGAILFLEDAGEETYRVDRLLSHLALAGALDGVAGIALGRFQVPRTARRFPPDRRFRDVLRDALAARGVPAVFGLPFGHVPGKHSLPMGGIAELDTRRGTLAIHAAAISAGRN